MGNIIVNVKEIFGLGSTPVASISQLKEHVKAQNDQANKLVKSIKKKLEYYRSFKNIRPNRNLKLLKGKTTKKMGSRRSTLSINLDKSKVAGNRGSNKLPIIEEKSLKQPAEIPLFVFTQSSNQVSIKVVNIFAGDQQLAVFIGDINYYLEADLVISDLNTDIGFLVSAQAGQISYHVKTTIVNADNIFITSGCQLYFQADNFVNTPTIDPATGPLPSFAFNAGTQVNGFIGQLLTAGTGVQFTSNDAVSLEIQTLLAATNGITYNFGPPNVAVTATLNVDELIVTDTTPVTTTTVAALILNGFSNPLQGPNQAILVYKGKYLFADFAGIVALNGVQSTIDVGTEVILNPNPGVDVASQEFGIIAASNTSTEVNLNVNIGALLNYTTPPNFDESGAIASGFGVGSQVNVIGNFTIGTGFGWFDLFNQIAGSLQGSYKVDLAISCDSVFDIRNGQASCFANFCDQCHYGNYIGPTLVASQSFLLNTVINSMISDVPGAYVFVVDGFQTDETPVAPGLPQVYNLFVGQANLSDPAASVYYFGFPFGFPAETGFQYGSLTDITLTMKDAQSPNIVYIDWYSGGNSPGSIAGNPNTTYQQFVDSTYAKSTNPAIVLGLNNAPSLPDQSSGLIDPVPLNSVISFRGKYIRTGPINPADPLGTAVIAGTDPTGIPSIGYILQDIVLVSVNNSSTFNIVAIAPLSSVRIYRQALANGSIGVGNGGFIVDSGLGTCTPTLNVI